VVAVFLKKQPQVDVLFGDIVFVDGQGAYLGHRKVQTPLLYHTWTCHLSTLSCATFFRRRVVFELGAFFDPRLRDSGDGEWMLRLLRRGVPMAALGGFTSVFAYTGDNMSQGENARREARDLHRTAPTWARWLKPLIILQHRLRRLGGRMYHQVPFNFSLYTSNSPMQRVTREVPRPTVRLEQ